MTVSHEMLMAYADGELAPAEMRQVELEIATDPTLKAEIERQRALGARMQKAFFPVLEAPIPSRLALALEAPRPGWIERLRDALSQTFVRHPFAAGGSLAGAALAAGLVIGMVAAPSATGDFASDSHGLVARAGLADALEHRLAANQDDKDASRVGITFRDGNGAYCRTFTSGSSAGIACRIEGGWRVAALAPAEKSSGDYHMAASGLPEAIRDAATSMIAGAPLNQEQEKQAVRSGWR